MPFTSLKILSLSAMVGLVSSLDSNAMGVDGWYEQPALCGDTLVFASEGDLWIATLPDDGGESSPVNAHRLTSGSGVESNPVLNADGSMVAYSASYDGNVDVYLMPIAGGGAPTRLTHHPGRDVPVCFSARRSPGGVPFGPVGAAGDIRPSTPCRSAADCRSPRASARARWRVSRRPGNRSSSRRGPTRPRTGRGTAAGRRRISGSGFRRQARFSAVDRRSGERPLSDVRERTSGVPLRSRR